MRHLFGFAFAAGLVGCGPGPEPAFEWNLPSNFPTPSVPDDNPMATAKVELGRFLFYDTRLSGNETQSCASCHAQSAAFTDGVAVSTGSTGEMTPRGSMTLGNVAYASTLTWMNPLLLHLEEQALVPMFGEEPVELGLAGLEDDLLDRLRDEPVYQERFPAAFPDDEEPFTLANVTRAIAAFERTMITANSPYDRYERGEETTMSESAIRGMDLFFTETVECFHCHGGFNFTNSINHSGIVISETPFENNGLYNIDDRGAYPAPNTGLYAFSGEDEDMGRFKPPTLRNVELTAPYMHDGTLETLEGVLDHYVAGGRNITEGENIGDGRESPNKSIFVRGFTLDEEQRTDLLNFLRSLTDEDFLTDESLSSPW